ncbi:MAG: hypothetical protein K9J25_01275 [Bacteroidales bacterium]|nr:hypothetical protein [Bacteroidales bacterium]
MKTLRLILAILAAISVQVQSQSNISISRPELSYYNDTLVILFDIRGCSQNNIFNIYPDITFPSGEVINTSALHGDIGDSIQCGPDKQIVWNLAADNFRINGDIEVQITAQQVVINDKEAEENEETIQKNRAWISRKKPVTIKINKQLQISKPMTMMKSPAAPGLFPRLLTPAEILWHHLLFCRGSGKKKQAVRGLICYWE